ncbi:IS3 family transposase [Streptomyces sp. NPDC019224]|uniref:IS3 family transposase n=1 Tax=Streptomyces sp. NPDC019224 TaxID=3154484 RepID=UPI0033E25C03
MEERIIHFFTGSGGTYGSPRITLDLWAEGWQVSVNTVAEIMAELGLQGEARLKIATWITGFYNPRRRHSAAGGLPPEEFERTITEARKKSDQRCKAA